jgi:hypothetical protein
MANSEEFKQGLERVLEGARKYRIALMCSERDPLDCHRCLLVGRALAQRGVAVKHLLSDGHVIAQGEIEDWLLRESRGQSNDLFAPRDERLAAAYRERSLKIAFVVPKPNTNNMVTLES